MKKPFYSRRRLKKMGIRLEESRSKISLYMISSGGSIHQSMNVIKMLKKSSKTIEVTFNSFGGSCGSFIQYS